MQAVPVPGFCVLEHPLSNSPLTGSKTWMFPLSEIPINVLRYTKLLNKRLQFLQMWGLFQKFKVFLSLYELMDKMTVVKIHHGI